jgi:hypothetical protein
VAKAKVRAYLSPTLVLLAFDWEEGSSRTDFLGFAISRTPGLNGPASSWLPNRIGFDGPDPKNLDLPSDKNPIQKFMWWDARINTGDRGKKFTYTVIPVVGSPEDNNTVNADAGQVEVTIPQLVENGIGTYFNRAVVSSQAFMRKFGVNPQGSKLTSALTWLTNGLADAITAFMKESQKLEGAIYHLTDFVWVIPALERFSGPASVVYNATKTDHANDNAVEKLDKVHFYERTRAKIMHDKFLVRMQGSAPEAVLMGSANFTTEGLATQANLLHTWESAELAKLYFDREQLLEEDPTLGKINNGADWSHQIVVGDANVRVFFAPEKKPARVSLDAVVDAVQKARSSVLFCFFDPTDKQLLDACFQVGTDKKMMFGLVNTITDPDGKKKRAPGVEGRKPNAQDLAKVALFHRSKEDNDVYAHAAFSKGGEPSGFWWEASRIQLPGTTSTGAPSSKKSPPEVYIHHKFVVIDGETDNPVVYTGSANMSGASTWNNDENLVEIRDCPRIARIYMAEFLRLYDHYRARIAWERSEEPGHKASDTFKLAPDSSWSKKYYTAGAPEQKSRISMSQ